MKLELEYELTHVENGITMQNSETILSVYTMINHSIESTIYAHSTPPEVYKGTISDDHHNESHLRYPFLSFLENTSLT